MKLRSDEPLSLETRSVGRDAILIVTGRVNIDTSPVLRERLLSILRQIPSAMTVDLDNVPYIDTSGLATLVEALKFARAGNVRLRLKLQERPRFLLEVTGVLPLFERTSNPNG